MIHTLNNGNRCVRTKLSPELFDQGARPVCRWRNHRRHRGHNRNGCARRGAYSIAATLVSVVGAVALQAPAVAVLAFVPMLLTSIGYSEQPVGSLTPARSPGPSTAARSPGLYLP